MIKKLSIPFISSRGFECGQACAAMIIKYYYPNFEPNFDQINKIIHHQKGKYTFPLQSSIFLDNFGVKVKCFSADDYKTTKEEPGIFHRWYGKEYNKQIKNIYINGYNWMVQEGRDRSLFEKRKTSFSEILSYFSKGYIVDLIIDWKTLIGKKGDYEGHSVIISGIEDNNVLIHDPDFGPYISYSKKQLQKAYSHPIITDDLVVAFGKKDSGLRPE